MPDEAKLICPRCQIGVMQSKQIPFSMIENGNMVNVSKMPAHVCDVCGNRVYDREPLVNLRTMLGASRRKNRLTSPKKKSPAAPKTTTPRKPKNET
jgi:YgiT-type zinc finger domain-containing protein